MKRILVTGNAGSGKSTLAGRIGSLLGIPCHSLDRVVWQRGWTKTPVEEKAQKIQELTQKESWVIDGVSAAVEAKADTIVFLDVPRRVSYWRVAKRNWRYLFRSRPGLPPGCPEVLIIPTLCRIIWNFPLKVRPDILARMIEAGDWQRHFHLKTESDLMAFLAALQDEKLGRGGP
jgi:adenylate kinase family enzyme